MRLLAISDIHNNLVAVRRLRALESNSFDAVVVAGDLGSDAAHKVLTILATFQCPVVYVYGNWDRELEYEPSLVAGCQLLHHNVVTVGPLHFTGFSGCPTAWGRNPVAAKLGDDADRARILQINRAQLRKVTASLDPSRTIVVTHERLAGIPEVAPGAMLHLFGHVHGFADRVRGATRFVNVSVLDRPVTVRPQTLQSWTAEDCRNFNAGNFVVFEIARSGETTVQPVAFSHDYPEWTAVEDVRVNGLPWIPEEAEWTSPSDPRLRSYRETLRR